MSRTILINASEGDVPLGEVRVAIIDNGNLVEFDVDPQWKEKTRGNIYRGIVTNVEPALQAAFVDFGAKKQGFLSMSDVAPHAYRHDAENKPGKELYSITAALKRKQSIIVQVQKEEIGAKGAALTTQLSLPGRYLVLMPYGDGAHVSRKIEDEEERRRVRHLIASLSVPQGMGVIVRTAGMEQAREVLEQDLAYLLRQWRQIEERKARASGPALLMKDHDAILRVLRDYLTPDVTRIVVDTQAAFYSAYDFLQQVMPNQLRLLEVYDGRSSLFAEFHIEAQVEQLFGRRASLPSGGYLIIDQTEALVSIDVNSGRSTREGSQEETAYRTNLEAVSEAARQLRLRDLGGIIVLDLIDMMNPTHRAEVERRFREATKNDKARFKISQISQHGLLELTRQRIRSALGEGTLIPCQHCEGRGRVRTIGSEGSYVLRALVDRLANDLAPGQGATVLLEVGTPLALSLLNDRREAIAGIEYKHGVSLRVQGNDSLAAPFFAISMEKEQAPNHQAMPKKLDEQPRQRQPEPVRHETAAANAAPIPSDELETQEFSLTTLKNRDTNDSGPAFDADETAQLGRAAIIEEAAAAAAPQRNRGGRGKGTGRAAAPSSARPARKAAAARAARSSQATPARRAARASEARNSESRNSESRNSESRNSESRNSESRNSESRNSESRNSESRNCESRNSESRNSESRNSGQRPAAASARATKPVARAAAGPRVNAPEVAKKTPAAAGAAGTEGAAVPRRRRRRGGRGRNKGAASAVQ